MTLLDLTKELFTYLVRFREQAAGADPPAPEQVAEDLDAIFGRMEDRARVNPALGSGYEQVRYCLAALCDEVALCGDWPFKDQWRQRTWEERLFGARQGGQRFFVFLDHLDSLPKDVLAVQYLCLTLGFCGCYAPGDPRLKEIKAQVLARLPGAGPAPAPEPAPEPAPAPPGDASAPEAATAPTPALAPPPKPRDLRYLMSGGLAVLAFVFTLGLGVMVLFNPITLEAPGDRPGQEVELTLPQPLAQIVRLAEKDAAAPPTTAPAPPAAASPTTAGPVSSSATTTTSTITTTTTTSAPTTSATTTATSAPTTRAATASVTATTLAAAPGPAPEVPATYSLHAGLFVGPIQSGRLAEQLAKAGFAAWVREERRPDGQVRYRVYVGPYAEKEKANEVLAAITARFGIKPFVVESPAP